MMKKLRDMFETVWKDHQCQGTDLFLIEYSIKHIMSIFRGL